ncbi:damage-control phosphatase ARMT1 [Ixodes scapularis]|uniref:damage-control phosphatase ARMT1 n=1 Tax=Ixodes scapularis TaxID=6945 RepID=UPI001A9F2717|nr:damage-control phosphatase ARMT1 [Ixodes scapularis]
MASTAAADSDPASRNPAPEKPTSRLKSADSGSTSALEQNTPKSPIQAASADTPDGESTDVSTPGTPGPSVLPPPLCAKYEDSFAYKTVRERLPVILTRVIDALFRDRMAIERRQGSEAREQSRQVVGRLSKLRSDMMTNKPLARITDDYADAALWNRAFEEWSELEPPRWFQAPWLYVECYLYRRIFEAFQLTTLLRDYDPFAQQKREALFESLSAIRSLTDFARKNAHSRASLETIRPVALRLIEVSLWGNRCDLSLSGGAASNPSGGALQETQSLRAKILCNQLTRLWAHLGRMRNRASGGIPTQLHLVMDNAGYEMVTDLCLLDYLQECGFISRACLHVKAMPWYVSDVMRRDLYKTLRQLRDLNHEPTSALAQRCLSRLESGAWAASEDPFWTLPHDYARMAALAPELYCSLQEADLVLFKGDLNYRKLVGDLRWEPSTPFEVALRGFLPTFLCALRTIKADTVAGVDADLAREVAHRSPDWMVTGEYALVQCAGRTLWSRDSEP